LPPFCIAFGRFERGTIPLYGLDRTLDAIQVGAYVRNMTFVDIRGNFPNWQDGGRRAEWRTNDGQIVLGTLWAGDETFDGEGEAPVFVVEMDDGAERPISDFKDVCFLDSRRPPLLK
jgi:hypothetical protein